jgi:uncharacterized protein YecE (DUF72 family)
MAEASRKIRIGTSGWHYKHWRGTFYPEGLPAAKWLDFYCERFDSVELNNTFYRLPPRAALEGWRDSTPANFLFAVKGSRFITHMKKLKDPEEALERFFDRADVLGKKAGPILFQLPPRWELNIERFAQFLSVLPRAHRYAFEFRDPGWNREPVYELLRKHRAAYCIFHLAGMQSPMEVTADFVYVRLHGPGGKYQGSYSDEELIGWARQIETWRSEGRTSYVYFDNDDSGYAARNALRLKELVRGN